MREPKNLQETESWREKAHWIPPDKEWLEAQLVEKSMNALANELECGWWTVDLWVRNLGVNYDRSRIGERNPSWAGGGRRSHKAALRRTGVPEHCAWCGQGWEGEYSLHLHHKDHDKYNGALENLCWLCGPCHRLETALWHMLKQDKIDLKCEGNTMVITFRKGEI